MSSLALVDPEGASKAAQSIQADGLTSDLNDLVADPSKISDENNALATKDLFGLLKAELKGFLVDMPRFLQPTFEKFLQEGVVGNAKPADIAKALKEVGDAYRKTARSAKQTSRQPFPNPTYRSLIAANWAKSSIRSIAKASWAPLQQACRCSRRFINWSATAAS